MKLNFKRQKNEKIVERNRPAVQDNRAVFSYYARGKSTNSQNTGRNEQNIVSSRTTTSFKSIVYIPSYIALFMIVVAGLYSCWLQPNPKVVVLNQEGTVSRPNEDYQQGIATLWRRSILNQTKLTVRTATIRSDILFQYSELLDADIELPLLGRRPTVILKSTRPTLQLVSTNGAFFIDARGKVLARTTDVNQNQLMDIPLIRDETGIRAEAGKNIVPESGARYLKLLAMHLNQEGLRADSITLPATAANEADVRLAGQPYYIKFSTLGDPRQGVGAYLAVKAKLDSDHLVPKEYIDVRVDEKVFYK
jgi:hypothetical protein